MKKNLKIISFGFLTWLIPFILAFFFFSPDKKLLIDIFLFKSIMLIAGTAGSMFLVVEYFGKIEKDFLKEGIIVGVTWFFVNLFLDLIILLPMSGMGIKEYIYQIGLRYLLSPIIVISLGVLLDKKLTEKTN